MKRPEYVRCVLKGIGIPTMNETWCGRKVVEWTFEDATHALLEIHRGGRLLLCPECSGAIQILLAKGTADSDD